jgi:hypothetical protein
MLYVSAVQVRAHCRHPWRWPGLGRPAGQLPWPAAGADKMLQVPVFAQRQHGGRTVDVVMR